MAKSKKIEKNEVNGIPLDEPLVSVKLSKYKGPETRGEDGYRVDIYDSITDQAVDVDFFNKDIVSKKDICNMIRNRFI